MKKAGIIAIVLGLVMTLFTGFTIITEKEVVDVGPLEINREEKTPVYWSPITGLVIAGLGGLMVIFGKKK